MKFLEKLGWFFVSLLPTVAFIIIQVLSVAVYMVISMLLTPTHGAVGGYGGNISFALLTYQLVGMIVFGIWYYFSWDREKRPEWLERPNAGKLLIIVFAGFLLQILVCGILGLLYAIKPELFQAYNEMMENAGITELSLFSILTTVIAAPIVEEFVFRGVTFRLARKVSSRFWLANCIQALAFGIAHMNLIQGTYAFFLGLALGYVYGKYQNIWVCILFHGAINLSGFLLSPLLEILPEQLEGLIPLFFYVICPILLCFCYKALGKIKPPKEEIKTHYAPPDIGSSL